MDDRSKDLSRRQFAAYAQNYVTSPFHAGGSDLSLLPAIAGLTGTEAVVDVATGAGHLALALAPHAASVTATDLTPEMLVQARRLAAERGVAGVTFIDADAERLPFPDAGFDVVTCRTACHHFPNVAAFVREAARVLKPGGRLVVVDNVAPEEEPLDRFINELERLRDPSHHRAWRLSEWEAFFRGAGLSFAVAHQFRTAMDREDWLARMNTPAGEATEVRRRLAGAPPEAREAFGITETHFDLHKAVMVGVR